MSLDVYLKKPGIQKIGGPRIFIREGGQTKEIDRREWDRRFPDREPVVVECPDDDETVFEYNITHNLNTMAEAVDLYKPLWHPDQIGVTHAAQLIPLLRAGKQRLRDERERLQQFNPSNGWGNYAGLLAFVVSYLDACELHPDAEVSTWG